MKRRRLIILFWAFMLIMATLTACTGESAEKPAETEKTTEAVQSETKTETEQAKPETVEPIDITVSVWDIGNYIVEGESDELLDFINEKFAINIIPVNVGWTDADEKYNVWAAGNQLPDLIGAVAQVGTQRYFQWIADGVVRALPGDLSAYPNVEKQLSEGSVTCYNVEDQQYFLPRLVYEDPSWWSMDRGIYIRTDWLEELNMEMPKTEQEFIDVMVAFTQMDPDGNGLQDTIGLTTNSISLMSQFFAGHGYTDIEGTPWVKCEDGKWRPAVTLEDSYNLACFLRDLYKAGGLDPNFAANTDDGEAVQRLASGQAGALTCQICPTHMNTVYNSWNQLNDTSFFDSIGICEPPLTDAGYVRFEYSAFWSESYISSSVDDEKMDRILKLFDYLYTEEAVFLTLYGFEGTDYQLVDGSVELLSGTKDDGSSVTAGDLYKSANVFSYLGVWASGLSQYNSPSIPQEIRDMCLAEREYRIENWASPSLNYDVMAMDIEERNDMTVDFNSSWVQFIMDDTDTSNEELYAKLQEEWDANGLAAAVEAVTEAAQKAGY